MKHLVETAIKAFQAAGKHIMEIYENEDFEVDDFPLTKADMASQEIIMVFLKLDIPVLSEEGKGLPYNERKDWKQLGIVDPIDGTKEHIKGNGEFTVNIALIEDQKPVLEVIYVSALRELYFASKETGSLKLDKITDCSSLDETIVKAEKLPIIINSKRYTVVASKSHLSPATEEYIASLEKEYGIVKTIFKGSSLKLYMVAEGVAQQYTRFAPTMEWDTAAGQAICVFAGKTVLDYDTKKEVRYSGMSGKELKRLKRLEDHS